ncbi:hypothetical protein RHMOL_Rhmol13G0171100 [Rhododendron molle]|uniref:Uncharacterized protein n=1 Tax=Rhododendron molle TaxID=49168 RepID=A0ACC0L7N3_RHOML|nr:hypothetical protein RHMOL_Rhmol13G0171100 [Rhododendron molle]
MCFTSYFEITVCESIVWFNILQFEVLRNKFARPPCQKAIIVGVHFESVIGQSNANSAQAFILNTTVQVEGLGSKLKASFSIYHFGSSST